MLLEFADEDLQFFCRKGIVLFLVIANKAWKALPFL